MEREILFRGKDEVTKEWCYGYLLSKNVIGEVVNNGSDYSITVIAVIPETVGQFTGREIKGQKLFEGDFFKVGNTLKVVKFFKMAFCICNVSDLENEHTIKVMGNSIYQYPDENWWKMFEDETYIIGNIHE